MFEKVNPAHPDKVADRIAGAMVDLAYEKEADPRIAVEVLIGHGVCHIIAETSVHLTQDEVSGSSAGRISCQESGGGNPLRRQRHLQGDACDCGAKGALRDSGINV